jgi:hypothetical protein
MAKQAEPQSAQRDPRGGNRSRPAPRSSQDHRQACLSAAAAIPADLDRIANRNSTMCFRSDRSHLLVSRKKWSRRKPRTGLNCVPGGCPRTQRRAISDRAAGFRACSPPPGRSGRRVLLFGLRRLPPLAIAPGPETVASLTAPGKAAGPEPMPGQTAVPTAVFGSLPRSVPPPTRHAGVHARGPGTLQPRGPVGRRPAASGGSATVRAPSARRSRRPDPGKYWCGAR